MQITDILVPYITIVEKVKCRENIKYSIKYVTIILIIMKLKSITTISYAYYLNYSMENQAKYFY